MKGDVGPYIFSIASQQYRRCWQESALHFECRLEKNNQGGNLTRLDALLDLKARPGPDKT
jgi:hypothetical protein